MKLLNNLIIISSALILVACAGSPFAVSRMSASEISSLDNYTLCKAATPRELYSPSLNVLNEVRQRKLNCGGIYSYNNDGAKLMQLGNTMLQPNTNNRNLTSIDTLMSSRKVGGLRTCTYKGTQGQTYDILSEKPGCRPAPATARLVSSEIIGGRRLCFYQSNSQGSFAIATPGQATCILP
jgi:hypothetical protein